MKTKYATDKGYLIINETEVRPSVYLHARKMENRLREKDAIRGKDGWHDGNITYFLKKTSECTIKILEIIEGKQNNEIHETGIHLAIKKCYDGSNFLMMLADNLRDELVKRGIKGNDKRQR